MTVRRLRDAWDVLAGRKVAVEPLKGGTVSYTTTPHLYGLAGGQIVISGTYTSGGTITS